MLKEEMFVRDRATRDVERPEELVNHVLVPLRIRIQETAISSRTGRLFVPWAWGAKIKKKPKAEIN